MTREEITEKLKSLKSDIVSCGGCEGKKDYAQALTETIEALQTEPCEDCISRQDIISRFHSVIEHGIKNSDGSHTVTAENILKFIEQMPSVTAERKTGGWVRSGNPNLGIPMNEWRWME